jgi:hypothetical protein
MEDMGPECDFKIHNTQHDLWNYIYFYLFLVNKDQACLNGAESDIMDRIESNEATWLPSRSSWAIQVGRLR